MSENKGKNRAIMDGHDFAGLASQFEASARHQLNMRALTDAKLIAEGKQLPLKTTKDQHGQEVQTPRVRARPSRSLYTLS
jgi:hypothetical protein